MDRRIALAAVVLPCLVGCGSRPIGHVRDGFLTSALLLLTPSKRVFGGVPVPSVGTATRVSVGVPLASVTSAYWEDYVAVSGRPKAGWVDEEQIQYEVTLPAGKFMVDFEDSNSRYYFAETRAQLRSFSKGKPYDEYEVAVLYRADPAGVVSVAIRNLQDTEIFFREVQEVSLSRSREGPFEPKVKVRRELIYTGKSGRNLGLMYREYRDDMARPAFFQQLQYDTESDPIIGYQSARFRILSATNTEVSYEVLSALTL